MIPLHLAAVNGHVEIANALLKKGADPLLGNRNFRTLKPAELEQKIIVNGYSEQSKYTKETMEILLQHTSPEQNAKTLKRFSGSETLTDEDMEVMKLLSDKEADPNSGKVSTSIENESDSQQNLKAGYDAEAHSDGTALNYAYKMKNKNVLNLLPKHKEEDDTLDKLLASRVPSEISEFTTDNTNHADSFSKGWFATREGVKFCIKEFDAITPISLEGSSQYLYGLDLRPNLRSMDYFRSESFVTEVIAGAIYRLVLFGKSPKIWLIRDNRNRV